MAWNVLIIGAGAIGSLVGGKLALAQQQVTLVGRRILLLNRCERAGCN
jgi:ketopantoate reductase